MSTFSKTVAASAITLATILATGTFSATPAMASPHCKKVYLKVVNRTGSEIKVIDLDYYDPALRRWRSEPVRNEVIPNGQVWQETRRLERVNAKRIRVRVDYRFPKSKGFGKWGRKQTTNSTWAVCRKGSSYQVVLRK